MPDPLYVPVVTSPSLGRTHLNDIRYIFSIASWPNDNNSSAYSPRSSAVLVRAELPRPHVLAFLSMVLLDIFQNHCIESIHIVLKYNNFNVYFRLIARNIWLGDLYGRSRTVLLGWLLRYNIFFYYPSAVGLDLFVIFGFLSCYFKAVTFIKSKCSIIIFLHMQSYTSDFRFRV